MADPGLTGPALRDWHACIARLLECKSDCEQVGQLLQAAETLVQGSNSMAILYPVGSAPEVTHYELPAGECPNAQVDRYVGGAYLLDPFYRAAVDEKREGLFLLREIAPDAFSKTEYFRKYYRDANLTDEACFLVQAPDGAIASLSIGRTTSAGAGRFSRQQVGLLQAIEPLVGSILKKWLQNRDASAQQSDSFGKRLDKALANFGSSTLTRRECEVLHMTMRGHSIRSMAEKLSASVDTVKTHRKNIYAKLDVKSQSELFYLFISALRQHTDDSDPLTSLACQDAG